MSTEFLFSKTSTSFFWGCIFTCIGTTASAQISAIQEDYKKELLKSIRPADLSIKQDLRVSTPILTKESFLDNEYKKAYDRYRFGHLDSYKSDYTLSPMITNVGNMVVKILPAGSTQVVYMGGHFYFISNGGSGAPGDGIATSPTGSGGVIGGLNLSGWKKKTVSKKSKQILKELYGIEGD